MQPEETREPIVDRARFSASASVLAGVGRRLERGGLCPATSGNLSMRLSEGSCIVTASGRPKGQLGGDDFVAVDLAGRALTEGVPSAEVALHCMLYASFPRTQAVLHAHSRAATVLSLLDHGATELTFTGYEIVKAFRGVRTHASTVRIPVVDNGQDLDELVRCVQPRIEAGPCVPAFVLRGHGSYAWGESVEESVRHLEALEFLLQCELDRRILAGARA